MDVIRYTDGLAADLERFKPSDNPKFSLQYKLSSRRDIYHLLSYRSAYGCYGVFIDPVGSAQLGLPKPFHSLTMFGFADFPSKAFSIELTVCPFRCNSRTTLVSYSTGLFGVQNDLLIYVSDKEGIVIEINGHRMASNCFPDYSQWQNLIFSWNSKDGTVTIHNDDRDEAILNVLKKETVAPTINCLFKGNLAQHETILSGGVLVIGQQQTLAGNMQRLVPDGGMIGALRRVRIWDHLRTTDQFITHKSTHITSKTAGLIGDWGITAASLKQHEALNFSGGSPAHLSVGNTQLNDPVFYRFGVFTGRKCYYSTGHFSFNNVSQLDFSLLETECSLTLNGEQLDLKEEQSIIDPEQLRTGLLAGEGVNISFADQIPNL